MQLASQLSFSKPANMIPDSAKRSLLFSLAVTLLIILMSVAYYIIAQPELPIFYSLAQPSQQLAPKIWLLILPVISVIINFLHVLLLILMKDYEEILLRLFGNFTVIMQFLLLSALVRIIYTTW